MIRLNMGAEPAVLRTERRKRLPVAIAAFNTHGHGNATFNQTLIGYKVAKKALWERQHGKCAFCERAENPFNQPVEHFRPKAAADDFDGTNWGDRVTSHYWWLTWTWRNLFFACDDCNATGRKGNRFPIESGQLRITPPTQPTTSLDRTHTSVALEPALLLNPRLDDPFEHLQWMPVNPNLPKSAWTWSLTGRSGRGDMTIRALDLRYRTDEVNQHLSLLLGQWIPFDDAVTAQRTNDAQRYWDILVGNYISNPKQPFRNAAWWAINSLCPEPQRLQLNLSPLSKPVG